MQAEIRLDEDHPANAGILRYLGKDCPMLSAAAKVLACSPASIGDPYYDLGTHPDLVTRLWDQVTASLPVSCRWVVWGAPALVRPDTGVVFAFARGTHTYALRLPPKERQQLAEAALTKARRLASELELSDEERHRYLDRHSSDVWTYSDGSVLDVRALGEAWVLGDFLEGEIEWCHRAYEYAT